MYSAAQHTHPVPTLAQTPLTIQLVGDSRYHRYMSYSSSKVGYPNMRLVLLQIYPNPQYLSTMLCRRILKHSRMIAARMLCCAVHAPN